MLDSSGPETTTPAPAAFRLVRRNGFIDLWLGLALLSVVVRPIAENLRPFAAWPLCLALVAAFAWYCVHARTVVLVDGARGLLELAHFSLRRSEQRFELRHVLRAELTYDIESNASLVLQLRSGETRGFNRNALTHADMQAILRAVRAALPPREPNAPTPLAPQPPPRPHAAQALRVGARLSSGTRVPDASGSPPSSPKRRVGRMSADRGAWSS